MDNTVTTTIQKLQFGINVFKGDHIKSKGFSDSLTRINDENDLQRVKNEIGEDLKVIINRDEAWFNVFTIPAFKEATERYVRGKAETLKQWGTHE